jgi:hypothetical protein
MYFLCAGHKSSEMFLAGYFIGASDRWSWCKKKMVPLRLRNSGTLPPACPPHPLQALGDPRWRNEKLVMAEKYQKDVSEENWFASLLIKKFS